MKRVEFTPPKGFGLPEGKQAGDTFESMATFQIKKDGRMCLVAIGDSKMPGYEDKQAMKERDEGGEMVSAYHTAANGGGGY